MLDLERTPRPLWYGAPTALNHIREAEAAAGNRAKPTPIPPSSPLFYLREATRVEIYGVPECPKGFVLYDQQTAVHLAREDVRELLYWTCPEQRHFPELYLEAAEKCWHRDEAHTTNEDLDLVVMSFLGVPLNLALPLRVLAPLKQYALPLLRLATEVDPQRAEWRWLLDGYLLRLVTPTHVGLMDFSGAPATPVWVER